MHLLILLIIIWFFRLLFFFHVNVFIIKTFRIYILCAAIHCNLNLCWEMMYDVPLYNYYYLLGE